MVLTARIIVGCRRVAWFACFSIHFEWVPIALALLLLDAKCAQDDSMAPLPFALCARTISAPKKTANGLIVHQARLPQSSGMPWSRVGRSPHAVKELGMNLEVLNLNSPDDNDYAWTGYCSFEEKERMWIEGLSTHPSPWHAPSRLPLIPFAALTTGGTVMQ